MFSSIRKKIKRFAKKIGKQLQKSYLTNWDLLIVQD